MFLKIVAAISWDASPIFSYSFKETLLDHVDFGCHLLSNVLIKLKNKILSLQAEGLKEYYNRVIDSWLVSNPGRTISIYKLSSHAIFLSVTPKNSQQGFNKSEIYQLNPDILAGDDI